jgi:hypothetical protein
MKTAVETAFVGKDRLYSRRFLQMCGLGSDQACWAELWLGNDVQDNFQPHACALSRNRSKSSSVPNQRIDGAIISHVVTEIGGSRPAATTESSC